MTLKTSKTYKQKEDIYAAKLERDKILDNGFKIRGDLAMEMEKNHDKVVNQIEYDDINKPRHYMMGDIEVKDIILSVINNLPPREVYYVSKVLKYICRYPYKNAELKDLKKCQYYLNDLITEIERKHSKGAE